MNGTRRRIYLFTLLILLVSVSGAGAQQNPSASSLAQTDKDDVLILANLTAKELEFETVPTPTVEFPGTHERKSIWTAERTNLPEEVQPGVTYRDIGIRLHISTRFAEIERIASEVLSEDSGSKETVLPSERQIGGDGLNSSQPSPKKAAIMKSAKSAGIRGKNR